jgi:hypothetical protein
MSALRRHIAIILIGAVSACSTAERVPPAPAEVCSQPGLWAVLTRPKLEQTAGPPQPLSRGEAAASGATAGAIGSVTAGAMVAGGTLAILGQGAGADARISATLAVLGVVVAGAAIVAGIAFAPVAAMVGAGLGAGGAHSEADVLAAEASLTGALEAADPPTAVREQVIVLAERGAGRKLYDCGDMSIVTDCRAASPEPVSTLLIITVSSPYFEVKTSTHQDVRLLLAADAEVLHASDDASLYQRSWVYRGAEYEYFDLTADGAALFRSELDTAIAALAAKVVDDLLIGGREEVHPTSEQPPGTVWTVVRPNATGPGEDCT